MNRLLALLLPLLALAGCGGGGSPDNGQPGTESWARNVIGNQGSPDFRRHDGSFDRADYRRVMVPGCAAGMHDGEPSLPAATIDLYCTCFVDRLLATNSDDQLRAMMHDAQLERRNYEAAQRACGPAPAGGRAAPGAGDEPPPPEEPVPSLNGAMPPPVIQTPPPRP